MRYVFIDRHRVEFAVTTMCRVLEVSKPGFYAWWGREPSDRARDDAALLVQIRRIHKISRATYGSPAGSYRVKAKQIRCGRRRVARLMRTNGVRAVTKRRYRVTTNSRHAEPIAPNLLNRRFAIDAVGAPDRVWAGDITYIPTLEGWLYLAVVLDLWSRRVIGWSMRHTLDRKLATGALSMAIVGRKSPVGLLYHSDHGVQYACGDFQALLAEFSMQCSMSRKGDCWDNAVVESFFASLKRELIDRRSWKSREDVRAAVFEYIEIWYNRQRRHSTLGYLSPMEFELAQGQGA